MRAFLRAIPFLLAASAAPGAPPEPTLPAPAGIFPISDLKPGHAGEVWTVFHGTKPEPFAVEVTGIVRNALGPGKSLIVCRLTDPRVQNMGAVAGMSGSPLYIGGRLAGALSYQIQSFETVHYAGFTPAVDLAEVENQVDDPAPASVAEADPGGFAARGFRPLRPVFILSGLSPRVADLMKPYLDALGLSTASLGGSLDPAIPTGPGPALQPGDAVSVALATGDITLAGTGTVSRVDGDRVVAFGHTMMNLGSIELPLCSAEIITIVPSALESLKIANTGPVIGTITQDRLSAVSGILGRRPDMIDVDITVASGHAGERRLHFQVARQQQLTPTLIATGLTQAIAGSNDAGLSSGFRLNSDVTFSPTQRLASRILYAGPQAFTLGLGDFVRQLAQDLQNPYEKMFPRRIAFTVEPLEENPAVTIDQFQLSRSTARPGDTVEATLAWRDYQGAAHLESIAIPIDSAWLGKKLEVILAPGHALDELMGRPQVIAAAQLRSFDAYLAAMRDDRPNDGLCLAVAEESALFTDQGEPTPELPDSLARIAAAADDSRFQQRAALWPLWERHVLPGKLAAAVIRRPLRVAN